MPIAYETYARNDNIYATYTDIGRLGENILLRDMHVVQTVQSAVLTCIARYCYRKSSVRLSVCPFLTLRYRRQWRIQTGLRDGVANMAPRPRAGL